MMGLLTFVRSLPAKNRRVISGVPIGDNKVDNQHRQQYEPVHDDTLIFILTEELLAVSSSSYSLINSGHRMKKLIPLLYFVLAGNGWLPHRSQHLAAFLVFIIRCSSKTPVPFVRFAVWPPA